MIECTALGYKAGAVYYLLEWDTQYISAVAYSQWPAPTCRDGYGFIMEDSTQNTCNTCTLITLTNI